MFGPIHQRQPDQRVERIPAAVIEMITVVGGVAAFHARALRKAFFKTFRVPWKLWEVAWMGGTRQLQGLPEACLGTAVFVPRTLVGVEDEFAFAIASCRGPGGEMGVFALVIVFVPHAAAARTERRAIRVKGHIRIAFEGRRRGYVLHRCCCRCRPGFRGRLGRRGGVRFLVVVIVAGERNHGCDAPGLQIAGDRQRVMLPVADEDDNGAGQFVVANQLEEVIEGFRTQRKI